MTTRIQIRRGTDSEWSTSNPVLADGEIGYARDTKVFKVGDGSTAWNSLPAAYATGAVVDAIDARVEALEEEEGNRYQILSQDSINETDSHGSYPTGISILSLSTSSGWSLNSGAGIVFTIKFGSTRLRQYFYATSTTKVWTRYYSGSWSPWARVAEVLSTTAELDFSSISAGSTETETIELEGAAVGDSVMLAPPATLDSGLIWSAHVTDEDTVSVRLANVTGSPIDPGAATWGVTIVR